MFTIVGDNLNHLLIRVKLKLGLFPFALDLDFKLTIFL